MLDIETLLAAGVITRGAIVDGDVVIAPLAGRMTSVLVEDARGPGRFVKLAVDDESRLTLGREADLLAGLAEDPAGSLVGPRLLCTDGARGLLVTEAVAGGRSIRDLVTDPAKGGRIGESLGATLARLHQIVPPAGLGRALPPLALECAHPTLDAVADADDLTLALFAEVRRCPGLPEAIETLASEWQPRALIHSDLTWRNILGSDDPRSLTLVDWELGGLGDPDWDLGSAFGSLLVDWLDSILAGPGVPVSALAQHAGLPLERLWPAAGGLWAAYVEGRRVAASDRPVRLGRSMRFAAIRLLQAVHEGSARAGSEPLRNVHLAANLMAQPLEGARALLGLTAGSR